MRRKQMVAIYFISLCWLYLPIRCWARLQEPEGSEDIQRLDYTAGVIFHAAVLSIANVPEIPGEPVPEINFAELRVDRWYKGIAGPETIRLKYLYPGLLEGHDCIDLRRASSWLIFAKKRADGIYELSDDCQGALPMSPMLAPAATRNGLEQLQRDLIAGLGDDDPALRLANIARLGGLKLRSSASALHEFVEYGSETEKQWAIYAALRSGDPSVFPKVEIMLTKAAAPTVPSSKSPSPDFWSTPNDAAPGCPMECLRRKIEFETGELHNPAAIPMLARLSKTALDEKVRDRALIAIRSMTDPAGLDALFELLRDPDPKLKSEAFAAIHEIVGRPECQQNEQEDAAIQSCENWWENEGRFVDVSPDVRR